jgi:hypothetical protein
MPPRDSLGLLTTSAYVLSCRNRRSLAVLTVLPAPLMRRVRGSVLTHCSSSSCCCCCSGREDGLKTALLSPLLLPQALPAVLALSVLGLVIFSGLQSAPAAARVMPLSVLWSKSLHASTGAALLTLLRALLLVVGVPAAAMPLPPVEKNPAPPKAPLLLV